MAKVSQEIRNFLSTHVNPEKGLARIPKSLAFISPGDVLVFSYPGERRVQEYKIVLVVSNKLGDGIFSSSRNNRLLSCYRIDLAPIQIVDIVLSKLYKNRRLCTYTRIKASLSKILGGNAYRTYNISKVNDLQEILLNA